MAKYYNFRCQYCDAGFVNEDRYIKHRCKQMVRAEEIRTPVGLAALEYYRAWMSAKRLRAPNAEQFLNSKLYTSFVKFAKFVVKTGIPNAEQYIKFMVREDVTPTIWTNDQIYGEYLRYLDKGADPYKQAQATTDFVDKLSDLLECDPGEIFDNLTPNEVILLLQQRRLTPWILLHSRKFAEFVQSAPIEQQQQIKAIVKPATWKQRRLDNPTIVEKMKEIVHELNW